ncbi:MAG TPA: double-strand break repair protein AddB [Xanthobacteraceae bacterium]|jgi:ATP-dependent helicase/nuclease subunit B|nr:double-strand break repair protein AddB [Xanthobacteraceae bacterium]
MSPRVFTIPASAPFLPTLIEALRSGRFGAAVGDDPLALASATLYLPTRRACRLMRDAFLQAYDAKILPRIVPIGDIDEDEIAFAEAAAGDIAAEALALPEALGGLERRLLLTRLIGTWAQSSELHGASGTPLVAQTPASACALADDLARLIDDMTMRGVSWDRLGELVPERFDVYWQLTLRFLHIAHKIWPEVLDERACIEPAERRDRLIKAEAARLARKTDGLVIAAGSTGSIPATAELIATIAHMPHGAVVLPGLDTDLDEDSWKLIAGDEKRKIAPVPAHPQFAMQALLTRIGITREDVIALATPCGRERLVSEALRPAAATDRWRQISADAAFAAHADAAIETLTIIEAANPEEEALAIAVALREAVHDGKSAALVTPDRALGRRVLTALARWHIAAEDSGGDALADTPAGIFARLAADTALGGVEPVPLLALLKHPLARPPLRDKDYAVAALERAILRGPRPRAGSAGLKSALHTFRKTKQSLHRSDPRIAMSDAELNAADDLVAWLAAALKPLEELGGDEQPLTEFAKRHRDAVAALSSEDGGEIALSGADGARLADALDELATSEAAAQLFVAKADYVELFSTALAGRVVRKPPQPGVQVRILGPLEARLTDSDRVVLGGLVEGTWPPESNTDAWLSRPMRLALGLDLPERRIGLSAHDFAQLLGARDVMLSLAAKIAGTPTVPSRFVQRLAAVAGSRWKQAVERGQTYVAWARELDRPERIAPAPQPAPSPPRTARPKGLSVTEIEHWLRDPYTIYAKHILRLRPLDAVDTAPGAAERGTIIHAAVGDFTKLYAQNLPADPVRELIALGEPQFEALEDFPEARAFWRPRFLRIAHWFARWDAERRGTITAIEAEIRGEIPIPLEDGTFKLSGVADRIERMPDGRYVILDYKTGSARSEKQVRTGLAPQLTLEAAMLRQGGFKEIAAGASVAEIVYVLLKGGEPAGRYEPVNFKDGTPDGHADRALQKLTELARRFDNDKEPYRSLVHPMWLTYYGDYDHLARVKEWSSGRDDEFGGSE